MKKTIFIFLILFINFTYANEVWNDILKKAKGQTVYFNAWGGDNKINNYIQWAGKEIKKQYDVNLIHVKINDTANVVNRILKEKQTGKHTEGSVDMIWVNGENFKKLKKNALLNSKYDHKLPNNTLINYEIPSNTNDFGEPVEGLEIPWGTAQFVFIYDSNKIKQTPNSAQKLLQHLSKNKGKFAYIKPPNFYGTTFLKQILSELIKDKTLLSKNVNSMSALVLKENTDEVWKYLTELHALSYKQGKVFPLNFNELTQLYNNNVIDIYNSFNPNDAAVGIIQKKLKSSSKTYIHSQGGIGNTHFITVPYNSSAKEGAMVATNFFISILAQARKNNFDYWGDSTVLNTHLFDLKTQDKFKNKKHNENVLSLQDRAKIILEPHHSWVEWLEKNWIQRFANSH